jgi:DNA-directed RNA polymerase specialized sigma24 family protein
LIAGEPAAVRTRAEIEEAVRAFRPAQWARLRLVAKKYADGRRMRPEDLLQEAFVRALEEDGRKCPRHVDVVKFLAEAMRSVAGDEAKKLEHRSAHIPVVAPGEPQVGALDLKETRLNAEDDALAAQNVKAIRGAVLALFLHDSQAHDLVEGVMEDFSADELRELTGLDKTAYASKRTLIRRTIDKHYPEGWKP